MTSTFPRDLKKLKKKISDKEDMKSNQNLKEIDYTKKNQPPLTTHTTKLHNVNELHPRKTVHENRQNYKPFR